MFAFIRMPVFRCFTRHQCPFPSFPHIAQRSCPLVQHLAQHIAKCTHFDAALGLAQLDSKQRRDLISANSARLLLGTSMVSQLCNAYSAHHTIQSVREIKFNYGLTCVLPDFLLYSCILIIFPGTNVTDIHEGALHGGAGVPHAVQEAQPAQHVGHRARGPRQVHADRLAVGQGGDHRGG